MALAGDKLVAIATVSNTQNALGTTTSTTFTATLTGGTAAGVAFVAPPSGAVTIDFVTQAQNSGADYTWTTVRVRTGATVGSGTDVVAASDDNGILQFGTGAARVGASLRVTGLTPGSTYNAQMMHRVLSGTGTFVRKHLIVTPNL